MKRFLYFLAVSTFLAIFPSSRVDAGLGGVQSASGSSHVGQQDLIRVEEEPARAPGEPINFRDRWNDVWKPRGNGDDKLEEVLEVLRNDSLDSSKKVEAILEKLNEMEKQMKPKATFEAFEGLIEALHESKFNEPLRQALKMKSSALEYPKLSLPGRKEN